MADNLGGAQVWAGILHVNAAGGLDSVTTLADTINNPIAGWTGLAGQYNTNWGQNNLPKTLMFADAAYHEIAGPVPVVEIANRSGFPTFKLTINTRRLDTGANVSYAHDVGFLILFWP